MDSNLGFDFPIGAVSLETVLLLIFLLLTVFFMIHSAIVAYHWLTYSTNRAQAFTATIIHIGVGAVILLAMGAIIIF